MSKTATSVNVPLVLTGLVGMSSLLTDALGTRLKNKFDSRQRRAWSTANNYHLTHSVALAVIAWMMQLAKSPESQTYLRKGFYLSLAGAVGFGSSIYALCLGAPRWVGPLTPTSGLILVLGWINVGLAGLYE